MLGKSVHPFLLNSTSRTALADGHPVYFLFRAGKASIVKEFSQAEKRKVRVARSTTITIS